MELIEKKLSELIPYANNPRKNDGAVDAVVESIKQCGYISPIVIDENNEILAGHTRYKAMKKLKIKTAKIMATILLIISFHSGPPHTGGPAGPPPGSAPG